MKFEIMARGISLEEKGQDHRKSRSRDDQGRPG